MVIAVYGTLRRGLENHHFLNKGSVRFLGLDRISGYDLYAGQYPYLVPGSGVATVELYEIDTLTLHALDELEGHPDLYTRVSIKTDAGINADIYLYPKDKVLPGTKKTNGNWLDWLESQF
jgi:gamma-glutamylcyclotransferase (GGCT)/AIG2-like uncharacterized protein YtfP